MFQNLTPHPPRPPTARHDPSSIKRCLTKLLSTRQNISIKRRRCIRSTIEESWGLTVPDSACLIRRSISRNGRRVRIKNQVAVSPQDESAPAFASIPAACYVTESGTKNHMNFLYYAISTAPSKRKISFSGTRRSVPIMTSQRSRRWGWTVSFR